MGVSNFIKTRALMTVASSRTAPHKSFILSPIHAPTALPLQSKVLGSAATTAGWHGPPAVRGGPEDVVNVMTVASGHMYERLQKIMFLSVIKNTKSRVKFWIIKNYMSPHHKRVVPLMVRWSRCMAPVTLLAWGLSTAGCRALLCGWAAWSRLWENSMVPLMVRCWAPRAQDEGLVAAGCALLLCFAGGWCQNC